MPSASLSVYLSRAISRCTKLALPLQRDLVLRLCFRVGLGPRVEQSGRDGRSRRRPVRADSGQAPFPRGLMPALPGRDKPGAGRARCFGGAGALLRALRGVASRTCLTSGSREAGLASPGAFPAVGGIWRLPAGGERRAPAAAAWPGMWISRVSRQVTNSAVTQAGQSVCPCSPAHPERGFREVKHTSRAAGHKQPPSSCP